MSNTTSDDVQIKLSQLLSGCAQERHQDLKLLYELTSSNLFSVSLRILKDQSLAEDCLQQVYMSIWRNAASYDEAKAKAKTWMNTITRNQALDMLRRNRHSSLHDGDDALESLEDETAGQEQQVSHLQDAKKLHHCLEEISHEHRQCIELAYFEGLSHQSISDQTQIALGTVKTWIRRGLARLQTCMNSI